MFFPEYKSDVILGNGELQLDPMSYNVFYKKREINLSPREFEVLYLLAQRPNWVIPRRISIVRSGRVIIMMIRFRTNSGTRRWKIRKRWA